MLRMSRFLSRSRSTVSKASWYLSNQPGWKQRQQQLMAYKSWIQSRHLGMLIFWSCMACSFSSSSLDDLSTLFCVCVVGSFHV
jgi:hypothetical protein